jgi:hypothetical protein
MNHNFYPCLSQDFKNALNAIANALEVKVPAEFAEFVTFKQVLKDAAEAAIERESLNDIQAMQRRINTYKEIFACAEEQRNDFEQELDTSAAELRKLINEL